jgi:hypothetical protein
VAKLSSVLDEQSTAAAAAADTEAAPSYRQLRALKKTGRILTVDYKANGGSSSVGLGETLRYAVEKAIGEHGRQPRSSREEMGKMPPPPRFYRSKQTMPLVRDLQSESADSRLRQPVDARIQHAFAPEPGSRPREFLGEGGDDGSEMLVVEREEKKPRSSVPSESAKEVDKTDSKCVAA